MANKKAEKILPSNKLYLDTFAEEQDMLTFVWLWHSVKTNQTKCKEAIRSTKNIDALVKKIKQIAIDSTSKQVSFYYQIIELYENKTDWIAIINKIKEKMENDI